VPQCYFLSSLALSHVKLTNVEMFKATLSLAKDVTPIPSILKSNPFKAQKIWPPDFTQMNPRQQFRLERRYRRRAKLKYMRPRWDKGIKLTSWMACLCTNVFSSFICEEITNFLSSSSCLRRPLHGLEY
jgi:hypothetical protein